MDMWKKVAIQAGFMALDYGIKKRKQSKKNAKKKPSNKKKPAKKGEKIKCYLHLRKFKRWVQFRIS